MDTVLKSLPAAGLLVLLASCAAQTGKVTLQNTTHEALSRVTINVAGQTFTSTDVPANGSVSYTFKVQGGESHYDVRVDTAAGKHLVSSIGYVDTAYSSIDDRIVVDDAGLSIGSQAHSQ